MPHDTIATLENFQNESADAFMCFFDKFPIAEKQVISTLFSLYKPTIFFKLQVNINGNLEY